MTSAAISGPPTALFSPAYYQDPYPTLTWLQENSPVHEFRFPVGDVPTWIVTRYEDVKAVLADPRYSAEAATYATPEFKAAGLVAAEGTILERGIAVVDPPHHTRLRRLAMKPFTTRRVQEWRETVRAIVGRTLEDCARRERFDVMDDYAGEVAAKTLGEILGFRIERHRELVEALNQAFPSDPALIHEAGPAFGRICEYSAELVAEKRLHPGEDLTSALIQTSDDDGDRLDEDELVGMVAAMIMGGSDTVRGFIGNAVLALLDHPDQADLLRTSPDLAGNAVEELLRYDGALSTALFRVTTEEIELAGTKLPAGAPVIAGLLAANRDPRHFPEPERLDIARTGKRHVGFGHGLHNCMGAALARLEGEIAIHALVERFPKLALDVPREELRYIDSWAIRRLTALPVTASGASRA
ncbi:cytochrome P450 family protein [Streptomyces albireticuli]|uniref:Cytochrome P450 n=1 Tax=Streptomyces albireticuli TaxID=1940 RepID=A0A2A2CW41_9ACTN|nr:cytochrome P450 [Streptomyces albireticuli]MCD9143647.1 cytochrome P450 [Streptomyces albireticuli]MCD9161922.1 cytochrome P450 [Streptomyces albireticuli]MCD9191764.1 cytochrome P450 [Streptomyces albireticuli]PAU44413.1 cytochrome P450 [Streptomyces albireticuli]